jgi:hypothetical protein
MRQLFRLALLLTCLLFWNCTPAYESQSIDIKQDERYPRWLETETNQPAQTSGITYIGQISDNQKQFLIADDIGKIHRLTIKSDTIFVIDTIYFSVEAAAVFADFPKLDFEEIFYDKFTKNVFLSVEGNGENFLDFNVIFKINFKNNNIFENEITGFEKIVFQPQEELNRYLSPNIGFEGLTADSKYLYLGLEGRTQNNIYADSTLIYVLEKSNNKIIKVISTKKINIHTICGLYSDDDHSIWGIDRNNRKLFHILFDEEFSIKNFQDWQLKPSIPGYRNYSYTASLESLTSDGENIYLVDDPWYQFFKPSEDTLSKLDQETVLNFNNFVPVIYKYNVIK